MIEKVTYAQARGVSKLEIVDLKDQFEAVAKTKGKAKIPLIEAFAKSNPLFLETYNFVFNPHITSGIAKKKMNKDLGAEPRKDSIHILNMFEYIKENNSGADAYVRNVQSWILAQYPETHEFLKNV